MTAPAVLSSGTAAPTLLSSEAISQLPSVLSQGSQAVNGAADKAAGWLESGWSQLLGNNPSSVGPIGAEGGPESNSKDKDIDVDPGSKDVNKEIPPSNFGDATGADETEKRRKPFDVNTLSIADIAATKGSQVHEIPVPGEVLNTIAEMQKHRGVNMRFLSNGKQGAILLGDTPNVSPEALQGGAELINKLSVMAIDDTTRAKYQGVLPGAHEGLETISLGNDSKQGLLDRISKIVFSRSGQSLSAGGSVYLYDTLIRNGDPMGVLIGFLAAYFGVGFTKPLRNRIALRNPQHSLSNLLDPGVIAIHKRDSKMTQTLMDAWKAHPEWDKMLVVVGADHLPGIAHRMGKNGFLPAILEARD